MENFLASVFLMTLHMLFPVTGEKKRKHRSLVLNGFVLLVEADKTQFTVQDLKFFSFVTDIFRLGQSNI